MEIVLAEARAERAVALAIRMSNGPTGAGKEKGDNNGEYDGGDRKRERGIVKEAVVLLPF